MDCKVTCFDRVMNLVMPLPKDKHKEAVEIIREYNFQDILDFCVDKDFNPNGLHISARQNHGSPPISAVLISPNSSFWKVISSIDI